MGNNLTSYMGACTSMPEVGAVFSRNTESNGVEDQKLWEKINELWARNGLAINESLSLERSDPLLREIFR